MKPLITYQSGTSFVHRLHPLTKLAWLMVVTVLVFAVKSVWVVLTILTAATILCFALRLLPSRVRGVRLFITTALLLLVLQIVFAESGSLLLKVGPLSVTTGGVEAGVYVAGRFLSVILVSFLFVLTTSPNDLAYGLMQVGLPYRYGFMLVTALRLVPVFEREAQIVYRAQIMRGAAYDRKNLSRFLLLARQLFLPMLVSALGKVDALAVSMEGRAFGKYPTRTYLREVSFKRLDWAALGLMMIVIGAAIFMII